MYSKSVMENFRSSLVYLHTLSGCRLSSEFAARLTIFYKGYRRKVTMSRQSTNAKIHEGKEPFSFSLYRKLARELLVQSNKDAIFTRLFLVLSWNLMCRAANTEAIRLAHVSFVEDALAIHFSHMKNDQEGDRPGDARHVYANPVIPEVCPLLALASYCMIFGFSDDGKLFPGKSQYDRYTKALRRALSASSVRVDIDSAGYTPSDFGSHSARKGAATYVSSCSTSGPSAASICLRAGCNLPGVQDTYIRYEAAGDMIVGRFVAGLPFERPEFATQPPFFVSPNPIIDRCIDVCFPSAPTSFRKVCEFCVASVAINATYLNATLPPTHLLFQTPLFRDPQLLEAVAQLAQCRNYRPSDPIRPTGIPPHIALLVTLAEMRASIDNVVPAIRAGFREIIEEQRAHHSCGAAAVEQILTNVLTKHGVVSSAPTTPPVEVPTPTRELRVYTWGGCLRRVPEDFVLPKTTLAMVWQLWRVGDQAKGHPPYHLLTTRDVGAKNAKRLRELQKLMRLVERCLSSQGIVCSEMDAVQAAAAFAQVQSVLPLPRLSKTGRVRRLQHLSWVTLARTLPK